MGSGKGGLIALGILIGICVIWPITAIVIVPFIIISLLIGFAIRPFLPKDHGSDIIYAAHTIADAIDEKNIYERGPLTPQEVANAAPVRTVTWDNKPLDKDETITKKVKAPKYFDESRSIMLED